MTNQKFTINRKNQLPILVFLAALTSVAQYIMQGTYATGHDPSQFNSMFFLVERSLWGLRAFVEGWVIIYLFMTRTNTKQEARIIAFFKFVLIGMLMITLSPTVQTMFYGRTSIAQTLGEWSWLWSIAISSFTPFMIGATGYAYQVQPTELETEVIDTSELDGLKKKLSDNQLLVADLSNEITLKSSELDKTRLLYDEVVTQSAMFKSLAPMNKLRLLALVARLNNTSITERVSVQQWADSLGITTSAVYQALKAPEEILLKLVNGNGNGE